MASVLDAPGTGGHALMTAFHASLSPKLKETIKGEAFGPGVQNFKVDPPIAPVRHPSTQSGTGVYTGGAKSSGKGAAPNRQNEGRKVAWV